MQLQTALVRATVRPGLAPSSNRSPQAAEAPLPALVNAHGVVQTDGAMEAVSRPLSVQAEQLPQGLEIA
jgi:hypothetical protein